MESLDTSTSMPKVLIVEDESIIAKYLALKLRQYNYEVIKICTSGQQAITFLEKEQPNLILMDILLGGAIDGLETAKIIKEKYDLPIVFLTACDDQEVLQKLVEIGSYGYLMKPCRDQEINITLQVALKKHEELLKLKYSLQEFQKESEERSLYLSMTSHDIKNPLSSIRLSAELLDRSQSSKKEFFLDNIRSALQEIEYLIEEILVINESQSSRFNLQPVYLNVNQKLERILEPLTQRFYPRYQFFLENHDLHYFEIYFDPRLFKVIVMNLLSNAIKYSPKGGIITVKIEKTVTHFLFSIKDQGIGIHPDEKKYILQHSCRGSNVENITGNGIGFSIIQQILKPYQGSIKIESELNQGTTVTLLIPLATITQPQLIEIIC